MTIKGLLGINFSDILIHKERRYIGKPAADMRLAFLSEAGFALNLCLASAHSFLIPSVYNNFRFNDPGPDT